MIGVGVRSATLVPKAIAFRAASTLGGVDFEEDGAIALLADKSLANKGQYKRDAALHFRC